MTFRVVVATFGADGRVGFNQVTYMRHPPPDELVLVAIDPAAGIYVWRRPHNVVDAIAASQARGYSRSLSGIDPHDPPPALGAPDFVPSAELDAATWERLTTARSIALNRVATRLFNP